jgi:peptidoglycan hydrolase-like protein with peptidoglycan-binding domain
MKKYIFIITAIFFSIYMFGCGKKQASLEELQEPMSMEQLSKLSTTGETKAAIAESNVQVTKAGVPLSETKLESLPPGGPYKPTTQEIQTALKNAGFYTGLVDGKKGPLTKKAIEEFQKANDLVVDGKVGPKTWVLLSKHLNPAPAAKKKVTLKTR